MARGIPGPLPFGHGGWRGALVAGGAAACRPRAARVRHGHRPRAGCGHRSAGRAGGRGAVLPGGARRQVGRAEDRARRPRLRARPPQPPPAARHRRTHHGRAAHRAAARARLQRAGERLRLDGAHAQEPAHRRDARQHLRPAARRRVGRVRPAGGQHGRRGHPARAAAQAGPRG